jgi:predicted lactoylglutathione lyase
MNELGHNQFTEFLKSLLISAHKYEVILIQRYFFPDVNQRVFAAKTGQNKILSCAAIFLHVLKCLPDKLSAR